MSLDSYYYRPITPPGAIAAGQLINNNHNRNASDSSVYTNDSSPDSVLTSITTPNRSPHRQHGPTLLPKIRHQDVVVEPASAGGPTRHRRVLSNTRNPPGFVPYSTTGRRPSSQRIVTDANDCTSLVSPISVATSMLGVSRAGSNQSSPVTLTSPHTRLPGGHSHSRSGSVSSVDDATLSRYGYPTYRQLPKYVSQAQPQYASAPTAPNPPPGPSSAPLFTYPIYSKAEPVAPEPVVQPEQQAAYMLAPPRYSHSRSSSAEVFPAPREPTPEAEMPPSNTLLGYLTEPTQAINLVRNLTFAPGRGLHSHFWWDIRNLRSWSSFSLATINDIPGLTQLLTTPVPEHLTPSTSVPALRLAPDSEVALSDLIRDIYAPRVNAALSVSQGANHLSLYPAPEAHLPGNRNHGGPHFLANYASDTERTLSGSPRGRAVGLVKSFDRWNTGMRNEAPHRRVEYLNGLSHLQRCMREHSCRYGFIMTEIELVCVRAGCDDGDDVPYFGYLELAAPIATKTSTATFDPTAPAPQHPRRSPSPASSRSSSRDSSRSVSPHSSSDPDQYSQSFSAPLTATLALYYLLLLSKSVPLPTQPAGHLNVGGPGALTRQRVLPDGKDKWIPEPQVGERRDAKRVRGWVWPGDAWHRREGGGTTKTKGSGEGKGKKTQKK
ncbi:hypothetical protein FQN54_003962 [Arachnomyces sp. PD_36]|nr:hypothetical protein FQN54_003962 [Arachnomyces sp. PD_36]